VFFTNFYPVLYYCNTQRRCPNLKFLNTAAEVRGQETTGNEKQYFGYSMMPSESHTIQNQIAGWLVNDLESRLDIVEVLKC
jgi:hypothetical protein